VHGRKNHRFASQLFHGHLAAKLGRGYRSSRFFRWKYGVTIETAQISRNLARFFPSTVTRSRWPRILTRSTQKPVLLLDLNPIEQVRGGEKGGGLLPIV
jgi:hypothetical protein